MPSARARIEVTAEDIPPTSHPIPVENVYREDVARPGLDRAEIAAGRESAAAIGHDDDARHGFIVGPGVELRAQRMHHAVRDGVERRRPVERDDAGRAAALEEDFGFAHAFNSPASRARR